MTTKHGHICGGIRTPTYSSWEAMKRRCNNPHGDHHEYYYDRGIAYDPAWELFENFLADMGERPEGTTLDRKNATKNYCKDNCRWADVVVQSANKGMYKNNKSGYKGVFWNKDRKMWWAKGAIEGKISSLYYGPSYEEAVKARKNWEKKNVSSL